MTLLMCSVIMSLATFTFLSNTACTIPFMLFIKEIHLFSRIPITNNLGHGHGHSRGFESWTTCQIWGFPQPSYRRECSVIITLKKVCGTSGSYKLPLLKDAKFQFRFPGIYKLLTGQFYDGPLHGNSKETKLS